MKDATDITIILDRSGSMRDIREDVIGGFNAFIEEQKKDPSPATVSLVQFDDEYEPVYSGKALQEVPVLTKETFVPRGWTALRDAVAKTIITTGERLSALSEEERPNKVLMLIITDGLENKSIEWRNPAKVGALIKEQAEKYKWQFVYIGANQDSFASGSEINITQTCDFTASPAGTQDMYAGMSRGVSNVRKGKGYTSDP